MKCGEPDISRGRARRGPTTSERTRNDACLMGHENDTVNGRLFVDRLGRKATENLPSVETPSMFEGKHRDSEKHVDTKQEQGDGPKST